MRFKRSPAGRVMSTAGLRGVALVSGQPCARGNAVPYVVNVTVRPGYNFPSADAALGYGHSICDRVAQGRAYADVMGDVNADLVTSRGVV